jgi:hypothetical protein
VFLEAWAVITKYHGLGDLNNKNFFSYTYEDRKSKIKVPSWGLGLRVSGKALV